LGVLLSVRAFLDYLWVSFLTSCSTLAPTRLGRVSRARGQSVIVHFSFDVLIGRKHTMATYKEIQNNVKAVYGKSVKTCWIAHVKELNGLPMRKASNRISKSVRKYECPTDIRPMIESSMRTLGLLT
jgi:hypothetical protein